MRLAGEAIAGPVVLIAIFLGALIIGLKASGPVEQARQQQLEFTADASHELRTPLSVIEAEVSLALRTPRKAGQYRDTLERSERREYRLRHIVEDLLWLARFDSEPPPPGNEPVDLAAMAETCADRFGAAGRLPEHHPVGRAVGEPGISITAPPEWIDRLAGVLVDNACRYAGTGGTVRIVVSSTATGAAIAVEDSGPGIPPEERDRLFDRFHRATDVGSGTGLGLAIADSIVRSTGGRWLVAESTLGGALMAVSWHRSHGRDSGPGAPSDETRHRPEERHRHRSAVTG